MTIKRSTVCATELDEIRVDQACSIKLDENGGTAAAATVSTAIKFTSSFTPQQGTLEIVLDHPFMFLIEETSTGAILFMGKIIKL